MRRFFLLPIYFYRYCLSPMLPSRCRYYPTCSDYAAQAITQYGVAKGSSITLKRLLRCHPWGGSGYDPIPDTHSTERHQVPTTHGPRQ